jgi:cell division protein 48 (CDC48)-like
MNRQPLSLRVLVSYTRDIGTGMVRIDHRSMDSLGVTAGDTIEVIGKKDGISVRCYPLLPSDEDQGITRIDPEIREIIGVSVEDAVTIRNLAPVPAENFARNKKAAEKTDIAEEHAAVPADNNSIASERADGTTDSASPIFILSGSCIDFEKERPKLIEFMSTLESAAHSKSKCKCYSDGKKALGWDFFLLEVDQKFVEKLRDIYPDIDKQEAGTTEERLALWMNKQLKKMKLDFHLKLSNVPQEKVGGFRLNPEHFRDKTDLEDLR